MTLLSWFDALFVGSVGHADRGNGGPGETDENCRLCVNPSATLGSMMSIRRWSGPRDEIAACNTKEPPHKIKPQMSRILH